MAEEASAGVSKDDVLLIQDFMMAASQLKAPATEGGAHARVPAMNCEHSRLARPSGELRRWGRKKLQATLGPQLEGLLTSPAGPTRTPPRHVGAHPAPISADPFNMAAAIERMGLEIGRGMRTLTMNQQRMDKTFALHKKKELGKKDLDDYDLAKLKGWAHRTDVKDPQVFWRNAVTSDGWKKTRGVCSRRRGCGPSPLAT